MTIALASAAIISSTTPIVATAHPPIAAIAAQEVVAQQEELSPEQPAPAPTGETPAAAQPTDVDSDPDPVADPAGQNVILVTAEGREPLKDPLENVNLATFELTQSVDKALVGPIAGVYEDDLPSPVRKGLRNFFRNLMEPVNALNYLLQLKPGKAIETLGRFTINSTVGVAGLFDTAKKEPFNLPFRRNGFGNTLGYYGVGPGPFLVVPLIGATTLRDLVGTGVDQSILPFAVGKPFNTPLYGVPAFTVNSLEYRIKFDERIEQINTSDDPYFAMRESYLCLREADIAALKNRPPPRDCSIAALMGLTPEAANVEPGAAPQLGAGMAAEPDPAIEAETTAEPPPPAIIYISQEVVQPIPES